METVTRSQEACGQIILSKEKIDKEEFVLSGKVVTEENKNVIRDIDEIPHILQEEGVSQPLVYLTGAVGAVERRVVLLGETHVATAKEERAAERILPHFGLIGCEGVDVTGFLEGRMFFWFIEHILNHVIGILSFFRRSDKYKSFIDTAREYDKTGVLQVLDLEKGWKPSIRIRIFFIVFPLYVLYSLATYTTDSVEVVSTHGGVGLVYVLLYPLLFFVVFDKVPLLRDILLLPVDFVFDYVFDLGPSRNRNMVRNLLEALEKDGAAEEVLVLTGSAHTKAIAKLLKKKQGFVERKNRADRL